MSVNVPTWVDGPAGGTPLTAVNLNLGSVAIRDLDTRLVAIEQVGVDAQTASYTLVLADAGKVVEVSLGTATTVTVPPNSAVAFLVGTVIEVARIGVGGVTLVAGAGVTLRTPATLLVRAQYSTVSIRKRATDDWIVSGDLG